MQKIRTCLWFDGQAEEAMAFYASVFKNAKILETMYCGDAGPGPKGSVLTVTCDLGGFEIFALNGGPQFTFTPAMSLFVTCKTQQEVDHFWNKLSDGGEKGQCGWLTDKFGVSWQIVPEVLLQHLQDEDASKSQSVMRAMMQMTKLDIAEIERAYEAA